MVALPWVTMWGCVRAKAPAKAGLLPPSAFAHRPLEEGAHWRALPLDKRINCYSQFAGGGGEACRRAEAEQLAGLWKLLNGELGVLPESGSLVLVFLRPSHIPASCIHLRCLPETFPGETAASCLREEMLKAPEVLNLGDWCNFSPLAIQTVFNSSLATIRGWRTTLEFFVHWSKGWYLVQALSGLKSGWLFGIKPYCLTGLEKLCWEKDGSDVVFAHGLRFSNLRYLKLLHLKVAI